MMCRGGKMLLPDQFRLALSWDEFNNVAKSQLQPKHMLAPPTLFVSFSCLADLDPALPH